MLSSSISGRCQDKHIIVPESTLELPVHEVVTWSAIDGQTMFQVFIYREYTNQMLDKDDITTRL